MTGGQKLGEGSWVGASIETEGTLPHGRLASLATRALYHPTTHQQDGGPPLTKHRTSSANPS